MGAAWGRTGVCGLGTAIGQLGVQTTQPLRLDYIVGSFVILLYLHSNRFLDVVGRRTERAIYAKHVSCGSGSVK